MKLPNDTYTTEQASCLSSHARQEGSLRQEMAYRAGGAAGGEEWAGGEEVRGGVEDGRLDLVEGVAE